MGQAMKKERKKISPKPRKVTPDTDNRVENLEAVNPGIDKGYKELESWMADVKLPEEVKSVRNNPKKATTEQDNVPEEPVGIISWSEAEEMALNGKLVRCVNWPENSFLFYRNPYFKSVSDRHFHPPVTKKFMESIGVERLTISGHFCKYTNGKIVVGYVTRGNDRLEDWEIYKQEIY